MQGYTEAVWERTRQLRIGFIAGLIIGLLAGWFFHGVISFFIRFFFVIVLLIPFVIAVIAWWRLRRQVSQYRTPRADEDDWPPPRGRESIRRYDPMDAGPVITVDSWETIDRSEPRAAGGRGADE